MVVLITIRVVSLHTALSFQQYISVCIEQAALSVYAAPAKLSEFLLRVLCVPVFPLLPPMCKSYINVFFH